MTAKELAERLLEHPEAEVLMVGNYGEAGYGSKAAPTFTPDMRFKRISYMGCPNPEEVGKPTFFIHRPGQE